jgi:phosphatidylglycerophosphatase C
MQAEKKMESFPLKTDLETQATSLHIKSSKNKKLVLFDFDGTITTKDTLLEFLIFYKGKVRVISGLIALSPILAPYSLKLIPNWKAKQFLLRHFVGGARLDEFNAACKKFSKQILPKLIRPKALDALEQYHREHATVIVVSASAENWVGQWCEQNGVHYIATQLEVVDGVVTGNFCGKNCYGPEKVERIKKQFDISDFDEIIAYGDSSGDREMFKIAHRYFYKPFRS